MTHRRWRVLWSLLSFVGAPLSLILVRDSVTSITLLLLFLGTGLDIAVEGADPSSLSRILTKIRYLLAPWGIVAVPASILLVMDGLRDIWPVASLVLVAAGLPALTAKYREDLGLSREESGLLFAVIRSCTLVSLILVVVATLEAVRSCNMLLIPIFLYLLSVPINIRGPRDLAPLLEVTTLYLILLIAR